MGNLCPPLSLSLSLSLSLLSLFSWGLALFSPLSVFVYLSHSLFNLSLGFMSLSCLFSPPLSHSLPIYSLSHYFPLSPTRSLSFSLTLSSPFCLTRSLFLFPSLSHSLFPFLPHSLSFLFHSLSLSFSLSASLALFPLSLSFTPSLSLPSRSLPLSPVSWGRVQCSAVVRLNQVRLLRPQLDGFPTRREPGILQASFLDN